jgi:hypothetical protein
MIHFILIDNKIIVYPSYCCIPFESIKYNQGNSYDYCDMCGKTFYTCPFYVFVKFDKSTTNNEYDFLKKAIYDKSVALLNLRNDNRSIRKLSYIIMSGDYDIIDKNV